MVRVKNCTRHSPQSAVSRSLAGPTQLDPAYYQSAQLNQSAQPSQSAQLNQSAQQSRVLKRNVRRQSSEPNAEYEDSGHLSPTESSEDETSVGSAERDVNQQNTTDLKSYTKLDEGDDIKVCYAIT